MASCEFFVQLANCFDVYPNQFLLIFDLRTSNFKFFKGKKILLKLETIVCIFWGKLFTLHRKGCDLVKISWTFAENLPEFLHRDSWKPPIRRTPLFTAEYVSAVSGSQMFLTTWSCPHFGHETYFFVPIGFFSILSNLVHVKLSNYLQLANDVQSVHFIGFLLKL